MAIAIRSLQAGKKFSKTLKQMMLYGARDMAAAVIDGGRVPSTNLRLGEFWAVKDVSFELKQGGSLGIIGANGSGKTTLLRMLNGIFMPDDGQIETRGRVGGLIHVGAGFHPMLSGRENIYINGAILGMSMKMIRQKFDAIAAFADLGDFLDAPVKQYSSGMYVRLGFAIAVHSEADILLLDEVLAVGDRDFQLKCYQKLNELRRNGATIVFVSHNEYSIREMTEHCLYLCKGSPAFFGPSEEAISCYLKDVYTQRAAIMSAERPSVGASKAFIRGLCFRDAAGAVVESVDSGSPLTIDVEMEFKGPLDHAIVGVNFYNEEGLVYGANSSYEKVILPSFAPGRATVRISLPRFDLPSRNYRVSVSLAQGMDTDFLDVHHMAYSFVVARAKDARGVVKFPTQWSVIRT